MRDPLPFFPFIMKQIIRDNLEDTQKKNRRAKDWRKPESLNQKNSLPIKNSIIGFDVKKK